MDDLVKLKCDLFDIIIKNIKRNLFLNKKKNKFTFFITIFGNKRRISYGIDKYFVVKNNKKYVPIKPKQRKANYYNDVYVYDFLLEDKVELEDGIYYKGFKVSELAKRSYCE